MSYNSSASSTINSVRAQTYLLTMSDSQLLPKDEREMVSDTMIGRRCRAIQTARQAVPEGVKKRS